MPGPTEHDLLTPQTEQRPFSTQDESSLISIRFGDYRLSQIWIFSILMFLLALAGWWVSNSYFGNSSAKFSLGFWTPNDRPGWLPLSSHYAPLIGTHYFGDFFQLFYLMKSHVPYTGHIFHTSLNPGYFLPAYLTSWLPYPLAGYAYLVLLAACWLLPAAVIAKRSSLLAVLYLTATTLTVPGLMALDLGQPQVFVYVLAIFSLYYIDTRPGVSAVSLGVAIAIKPYMALFLLIYLCRRDYRSALRAALIGVVINLAMAIALVGTSAMSLHFWTQIYHGIVSYGSGGNLQIWSGGAFLRNNSSLYGFALTLAAARIPGLSPTMHVIANHYNLVTGAALVVTLGWFIWRRNRLSTEMQWVYLAIVVLLIPSFSLGYAWLLLLVPLASRAMTQPQKEDDHLPNSQRPSILTGAFPFIVMLAVAIYPFNIAGTAFRVAEFGPNGNTLATPICLLILLVTIWVRPRRAVHGLNNDPGPIRRVLQFPVFLAPLAQISVALLCFSLSYR
jgi:hypothetical protein